MYPRGDRISNFPDEILTQILQFLPMKEAIRTSVLSTRWISLWTFLPTLHYDRYCYTGLSDRDEPKRQLFIKFVKSALLDHKMPYLDNVSLYYPKCNASVIKSWISAAIRRNVSNLHLTDCVYNPTIVLNQNLFFGCTVVELELSMTAVIDFPVASPACFPKLKVLRLGWIGFKVNNDSATNLISSCPVLEDLKMTTTDPKFLPVLNVSATCLKKFTLEYAFGKLERVEFDNVPKIIFNTPALEYLRIYDFVPHKFEVKDCSSVVRAEIQFWNYMSKYSDNYVSSCVLELLNGISNLTSLSILDCSVSTLCDIDNWSLPTFSKLTRLELRSHSLPSWNYKVVDAFLKSCPVLEVLTIDRIVFRHDDLQKDLYNDVPSCVISHLKTIIIYRYLGNDNEVENIRFFLKNANVLEKMILKGFINESGDILTFPRASPTCQIEF